MSTNWNTETETFGSWSNKETVCLLNWNDYCLIKGLKFQETITATLKRDVGTLRHWTKIKDKLRRIARKFPVLRLSIDDILREGTRCIPADMFPEDWLAEGNMNEKRKRLRIPPIGESYLIYGEVSKEGDLKANSYMLPQDNVHNTTLASHVTPPIPVSKHEQKEKPKPIQSENAHDITFTSDSDSLSSVPEELDTAEASEAITKLKQSPSELLHPLGIIQRQSKCHMCARNRWKCVKTPSGCSNCDRIKSECIPQPPHLKRRSNNDNTLTMDKKRRKAMGVSGWEESDSPRTRSSEVNPDGVVINQSSPVDHKKANQHGAIQPAALSKIEEEKMMKGIESLQILYEKEQFKAQLLSEHASWLLQQLERKRPMTQEESERLRSITRTIENEDPSQVLYKLKEDLNKADKDVMRCRTVMKDLQVSKPFTWRPESVELLADNEIDLEWRAVRECVQTATGLECSGPLPQPEVMGFFAGKLDSFLNDFCSEKNLIAWFVAEIAPSLENQCVLQTLVTAMLCRRVFADRELMFRNEHSGISSKIYLMISLNGDLAAVRDTDARATKLLIRDELFQREKVQKAVLFLADELAFLLRHAFASHVGVCSRDDFLQCCERAIKFKLKLMVSTMDYRIFFCSPGTLFDSAWMEAEDSEGCPLDGKACKSKRVRLCLFPAITQHQSNIANLSTDDITAAYVCNKPFPLRLKPGEMVDAREIVSKAVVVVD